MSIYKMKKEELIKECQRKLKMKKSECSDKTVLELRGLLRDHNNYCKNQQLKAMLDATFKPSKSKSKSKSSGRMMSLPKYQHTGSARDMMVAQYFMNL